MPMKHGEELWVGVGNDEPETSNPEPVTKISILQDSKSPVAKAMLKTIDLRFFVVLEFIKMKVGYLNKEF